MIDRLAAIIDAHVEASRNDQRDLDQLLVDARRTPAPRDFAAALGAPGPSVIAEVKRRSPSVGVIDPGLDPAALANDYEKGGAACISVLTDTEFFGGSAADLRAVRARVGLPILRKDFTVDARDIADARIMGADAVLLIVACLSDAQLREFIDVVGSMDLTALVETHDEDEMQRALSAGARVIGVNQRNLRTFEVDVGAAQRMSVSLDPTVINVAESAVRTVDDARVLFEMGYDAVLVGTALVTNEDPAGAIRAMTCS